jgi:hypothetical protein
MKSKSSSVKSAKYTKYENQAATGPAEAFFVPLGDGPGRFSATAHTAGPWAAEHQHAGPPTALVARELLGVAPRDKFAARLTFELLGPIPVADVDVSAAIERPGRSVDLVRATMSASGRDVMRATAWFVAPSPVTVDAGFVAPPLPARDARPPKPWDRSGYVRAMRWRFARGGFGQPGPATVWGSMRVPLIAGEDPHPLIRLLTLADSASGVSAVFDTREWLFVNPELTIHLHRLPEGEWIGLDAETLISAGGAGLTTATIFDRGGAVGRSAQSLLVRRR